MDDAFVVRDLEGVGDLPGDGQRLGRRQPRAFASAADQFRQRVAFDELEHQELNAVGFFEAVDRADVGVIERGQHPRLALEPREPIGVAGERASAGS